MKKEERGKEKEERSKKEERGNAKEVLHLPCGRSAGGAHDTRDPTFARGVRVARSRKFDKIDFPHWYMWKAFRSNSISEMRNSTLFRQIASQKCEIDKELFRLLRTPPGKEVSKNSVFYTKNGWRGIKIQLFLTTTAFPPWYMWTAFPSSSISPRA